MGNLTNHEKPKPEPDLYHSFDRCTGLRFSDTMTREQYDQMIKNREKEHGK